MLMKIHCILTTVTKLQDSNIREQQVVTAIMSEKMPRVLLQHSCETGSRYYKYSRIG